MSIANLIGDIKTPYGGYPLNSLLYFGWFLVISILALSFFFQADSLKKAGK